MTAISASEYADFVFYAALCSQIANYAYTVDIIGGGSLHFFCIVLQKKMRFVFFGKKIKQHAPLYDYTTVFTFGVVIRYGF